MPTLATFSVIPNVQPLPDPPLWRVLLLEQPFPAVIVLAALGVLGFWLLHARGSTRPGLAVLIAGLVLAAGVYAAATLVTTTTERLRVASAQFVDALAEGDQAEVRAKLAPDVRLNPKSSLLRLLGSRLDREGIIALIDTPGRLGMYELEAHNVRKVEAVVDARNAARTQVHIWGRGSGRVGGFGAGSGEANSFWTFHWMLDDATDEWLIVELEEIDTVAR